MPSELKKLYWNIRAGNSTEIVSKLTALFFEVMTRAQMRSVDSKPHHLPNALIISLTSYPPRFKKLHLTLKCLLNQSARPDLIVLWVAYKDFDLIPKKVLSLKREGFFEIRTCKDLGPGKKIIPSLKEYENCFIVTSDDDIYYGPSWLSGLIKDWRVGEKVIIANRVHKIILQKNNIPVRYGDWEYDVCKDEADVLHFATGGAGALYPPNCFHSEVVNMESYLLNCHRQDDIWLYWMARKNDFVVRKCKNKYKLITWLGCDDTGLYANNIKPDGNDAAIERMIEVYGTPY